MSKPRDVAIDTSDDAIEDALSDHHLVEVARMIERSQAENSSPETSVSDSPAGSNHRS